MQRNPTLLKTITVSDLERIKKFNTTEPLNIILNYFKKQNIDYIQLLSMLQKRYQSKTMIPYRTYQEDWNKITILFIDYSIIKQEYLYIGSIYDVFSSEKLTVKNKGIANKIIDYTMYKVEYDVACNDALKQVIENPNSLSNNYFVMHTNGDLLKYYRQGTYGEGGSNGDWVNRWSKYVNMCSNS